MLSVHVERSRLCIVLTKNTGTPFAPCSVDERVGGGNEAFPMGRQRLSLEESLLQVDEQKGVGHGHPFRPFTTGADTKFATERADGQPTNGLPR